MFFLFGCFPSSFEIRLNGMERKAELLSFLFLFLYMTDPSKNRMRDGMDYIDELTIDMDTGCHS